MHSRWPLNFQHQFQRLFEGFPQSRKCTHEGRDSGLRFTHTQTNTNNNNNNNINKQQHTWAHRMNGPLCLISLTGQTKWKIDRHVAFSFKAF